MEGAAVWKDMVSNTTAEVTGSKEVLMILTEHYKVHLSFCLTGKADWSTCKPSFVFKGSKRETKFLHVEFQRKCSVATSTNGWMNEGLTVRWCSGVLGKFSKRLLEWGSYDKRFI